MTNDLCRVLVIDDTPDVLSTVAGVLSDAGYTVKMASNEKQAIGILKRENKFHFIVLDVRLRGDEEKDDSGVVLARAIRKHGIHSKIIFVSGKRILESHVKAVLEYGVIGYIEKKSDWTDSVKEIIQNEFSKFDVLLCHNSEDKSRIKQIGRKLMNRGIRPWLDEWELPPGRSWQRCLEQQIEDIKSVAVFVGKSGLGPWQEMEIMAFLSEFVKRDCPVIPVLLNNAPKKPTLPVFLRQMTWVDFRRSDPDPMRHLIWGITGKRR